MWSFGQVDEVFVNKDAFAFGNRSAADNAGDAWPGVVAEEMRCRKGCRRIPIKVEAGHGRSFTWKLETRLVDLRSDFCGAAVETSKGVHGAFYEECIGKEKDSGVGPRF